MGTNCVGEHECEPNYYPDTISDFWTCPDCFKNYYAFDVHEHFKSIGKEEFLKHVPAGALGWTTRDPSTTIEE